MTLTRTATSPALEQARRLQAAADIFNRELFDGALPPTMLRLGIKKNARGTFFPDKFTDEQGNKHDCIQLNSTDAATRTLIELLSTLVHEQCHQYICRVINQGAATGGHGVEWRRKMDELGLPPIRIGSTWRQATHEIDPDGAYATCVRNNLTELERLPWQELARESTRGRATGLDKVKFTCPSCESKAWARASAELLCGTCSNTARLVVMIPEIEAVGGGGRGSASAATSVRTEYPEPTLTPSLPVWTDETGRELQLHTGLDHPPQDQCDALVVMLFGVESRNPDLWAEVQAAADPMKAAKDDWQRVLKRLWRHRASILHPDVEGGSEVAFKVLSTAYRMLQQPGKGEPFYATTEEVRTAAARGTA